VRMLGGRWNNQRFGIGVLHYSCFDLLPGLVPGTAHCCCHYTPADRTLDLHWLGAKSEQSTQRGVYTPGLRAYSSNKRQRQTLVVIITAETSIYSYPFLHYLLLLRQCEMAATNDRRKKRQRRRDRENQKSSAHWRTGFFGH